MELRRVDRRKWRLAERRVRGVLAHQTLYTTGPLMHACIHMGTPVVAGSHKGGPCEHPSVDCCEPMDRNISLGWFESILHVDSNPLTKEANCP